MDLFQLALLQYYINTNIMRYSELLHYSMSTKAYLRMGDTLSRRNLVCMFQLDMGYRKVRRSHQNISILALFHLILVLLRETLHFQLITKAQYD